MDLSPVAVAQQEEDINLIKMHLATSTHNFREASNMMLLFIQDHSITSSQIVSLSAFEDGLYDDANPSVVLFYYDHVPSANLEKHEEEGGGGHLLTETMREDSVFASFPQPLSSILVSPYPRSEIIREADDSIGAKYFNTMVQWEWQLRELSKPQY